MVSLSRAIFINVLLLGLFAVQHSLMARPFFKAWWTKLVPVQVERSTYTLLSSLALILIYWQWRPMPEAVWTLNAGPASTALQVLFFAGFALVLYTTFLIDHFDLFGLRQVFLYLRGIPYTDPTFATPSLYKIIRHPLYVGWLLAFWCTPVMSQGHLLFSVVTTLYIFIAIKWEERDLVRALGEDYQRYRERVPMMLPWPKRPT